MSNALHSSQPHGKKIAPEPGNMEDHKVEDDELDPASDDVSTYLSNAFTR